MKEYKVLDHMKRVDKRDHIKETCYYFPHHAVIKDTRLKVVFDGSAPTSSSLRLGRIFTIRPPHKVNSLSKWSAIIK